MNVIFLTVSRINDINQRGIYTDLMRKFRDEGHSVYIATPFERQFKLKTKLTSKGDVHILGVKTLNIQKTNFIEKGLATICLESQFKLAIKKYLSNISFDLIIYSTPPITFTNTIKYLKNRNKKSVSYLLLKDIFPQNAVDLGVFSKKSIFYKYFRRKEIQLYRNSDYIGCMSPANVEYLLEHNSFLEKDRVKIAPNSIEVVPLKSFDKSKIRRKYNLPLDKPIFIYGGNIGKPQGVDFLIKCLDANKKSSSFHLLIVGSGTEFHKIDKWYQSNRDCSVTILKSLPKEDYDLLVQTCDVGLVFLDYKFTIPNYPSRLLSYLEYKMPIIAAIDRNTDVGSIAKDNGFGYFCASNDVKKFNECIEKILINKDTIKQMGLKGHEFLLQNYLVKHTYSAIMSQITNR